MADDQTRIIALERLLERRTQAAKKTEDRLHKQLKRKTAEAHDLRKQLELVQEQHDTLLALVRRTNEGS